MVAICLVGALGGGYAAFFAMGGFPAQAGFFLLALLWWATTFMAYWVIWNGQLATHQMWMTYSYALTLAAVSLRLELPLFQALGLPFMEAYTAIAWLCWVPNLIIAHSLILSHQLAPALKK